MKIDILGGTIILGCIYPYLDDLLSLNDDGAFNEVYKEIYTVKELKLSRTDNQGVEADYLDMNISFMNTFFIF